MNRPPAWLRGSTRWMRQGTSIRLRVLAIAVIPTAVLLILGVGASGYLVNQGYSVQNWATQLESAVPPSIQFLSRVEEERRLTLLRLGGDTQDTGQLAQVRQQVDAALAEVNSVGGSLLALNPQAIGQAIAQFRSVVVQLPGLRAKVDSGQVSIDDAYAFYNQLFEVPSLALAGLAATAPDPTTAAAETTSTDLVNALDSMSRANALAAGAVSAGGLSEDELREYRDQVGTYHTEIQQLTPTLPSGEQAQVARITASAAWQQLTTVENAVIDAGAEPRHRLTAATLPVPLAAWQQDATTVTSGLTTLWSTHHQTAEQSAVAYGNRTLRNSLLAGAGVLIVTILALLIAIRLSNRLIQRLKRLRADTLELADNQLPDLVERLRDGEAIDLDTEVPTLDHGRDEIGEVADAFNKAQQTAVAAAAQEARTRTGMNAVFLNIAHRSQIVVRRQLEVLDEAEGKQEDPAHLELLFRLDHLATRARRNAENLVILGGGRPGRKWRNPVLLDEITRSAVSETEDYARIGTVRVPDVAVKGGAVADLIHLLAELVDNATSFSPPGSRVEVRGNTVGKGVIIEIEDQGLGIAGADRARFNAMLHNPPDFRVMALSGQLRLGLFVVAQLAARHDITVTLADSDYGGTRAIVLVPTAAIADTPATVGAPATARAESATPASGIPLPRPYRATVEPAQAEMSWPDVRWPEEDEPPMAPRQAPPPASIPPVPDPPASRSARPMGNPPASAPVPVESPPTYANTATEAPRRTGGGRTPLPRRRRQANLAPQLAAAMTELTEPAGLDRPGPRVDDDGQPTTPRPPDKARDTVAALLQGTRQGRQPQPRHRL